MPADHLARSDTARSAIGHVHLGAFSRAFVCIYMAKAMEAAGGSIVGVSLRSTDTRDALRPQGWACASVTLAPDGPRARVIDVPNDVLVAPEDPDVLLTKFTDPDVRIVSLTVTEKGYCHNPAIGALNPDHHDIRYDLYHDLSRSAPGYLVRTLQRRRAAGLPAFPVLSCDNLLPTD